MLLVPGDDTFLHVAAVLMILKRLLTLLALMAERHAFTTWVLYLPTAKEISHSIKTKLLKCKFITIKSQFTHQENVIFDKIIENIYIFVCHKL